MTEQMSIDECIEVAVTGVDGRLPHNFDRLFMRLEGIYGFDRVVVAVRDGRMAWAAFNDELIERTSVVDVWRTIYAELDHYLMEQG